MDTRDEDLMAIRKDIRAIRWVVTITAAFYLVALFLQGLGQLVKHFV